MNEIKQRHGCINVWLWLVIISNLCLSIYYVITMFECQSTYQVIGSGLMAIFGVCNVLGSILLFRWNKYGFYLFILVAILTAIVNVLLLGKGLLLGLQFVCVILIWFGILQIRKNGFSAWSLMEKGWDYKHCRHLYQVFGIMIGLLCILSFIAVSRNYKLSSDEYLYQDNDTLSTIEKSEVQEDSIKWIEFYASDSVCMIKAPDGFREMQFNDDQILGLVCTDYDPAVIVIQESVDIINSLGIVSSKEYANALVKNSQKQNISDAFKKISDEPYGDNSYLIVYEISIDGTMYRYNVLTTHTKQYYYSCQIFCLSEYADNLQLTISRMLGSFKVNK